MPGLRALRGTGNKIAGGTGALTPRQSTGRIMRQLRDYFGAPQRKVTSKGVVILPDGFSLP